MIACRWLCAGVALSLALAALADDKKAEPLAPQAILQLFNGKNLAGLYTWVKGTGRQDPKKVFTVRDGMIHVSGAANGYVATEKEYRDYRVVVEYRWGKNTFGSKYVRNSGILLDAVGPDGAVGGA